MTIKINDLKDNKIVQKPLSIKINTDLVQEENTYSWELLRYKYIDIENNKINDVFDFLKFQQPNINIANPVVAQNIKGWAKDRRRSQRLEDDRIRAELKIKNDTKMNMLENMEDAVISLIGKRIVSLQKAFKAIPEESHYKIKINPIEISKHWEILRVAQGLPTTVSKNHLVGKDDETAIKTENSGEINLSNLSVEKQKEILQILEDIDESGEYLDENDED